MSRLHRSPRGHRAGVALAVAVCAAPAAVIAVAPAAQAATPVKGQVVGAPYVASGKSALPVLLSKVSARKAGLRSPVGVLLVKRSTTVVTPGGSKVKPGTLRVGDTFRVKLSVKRAQRRAAYPTVSGTGLKVTKRDRTLSNAELTDQLTKVQGDLASLTTFVNQLATYTVTQIGSLRTDLTDLRADYNTLAGRLDTLEANLAALQAVVASNPSLPGNLTTQVNSLTTQVNGLLTSVGSLTTGLGSVTSNIGSLDLQSLLSGLSAGSLTGALTNIGQLQSLVGGINVGTLSTQLGTLNTTLSGVLTKIGGVSGTDLQTQINTLSTTLGTVSTTLTGVQGKLTFLCGSNLVGGALGGVLSVLNLNLLSNIGSCPS